MKKGQQATAVALASHLWWQTDVVGREGKSDKVSLRFLSFFFGTNKILILIFMCVRQPLYRDGKRVLECLQKSLRIATSSIDELTSVQLYCDALDQYLYYFERQVDAVRST